MKGSEEIIFGRCYVFAHNDNVCFEESHARAPRAAPSSPSSPSPSSLTRGAPPHTMDAFTPVSPRGECSVCHGTPPPGPGGAVRAAPCAHGPFW